MLYVYYFEFGTVAESPRRLTVYELAELEAANGSCVFAEKISL